LTNNIILPDANILLVCSLPIYPQELDVCGQEASEGSDSVIYKQVGPVLIKNGLDEARETVDKRLEFISGEM